MTAFPNSLTNYFLARRLRRAFLALLIVFVVWQPLSVSAQTVAVDNLSASGAGFINISGTQWVGFRFQVGSTDQRLNEWSVVAAAGGTATNLTLSLYALDAGTNLPSGAALASAVVPWVPGATNRYTVASLGAIATTTLTANAKYAVTLGPTAAGTGRWAVAVTPPTFSGGFSAVGGYLSTTNSGGTWSNQGLNFPIQLKVTSVGAAATVSVPTLEFWSLSVLGILVAGFAAFRLRRSYAA